ncbi:hypothetical protein [Caminibacter pacificus]
MRKSIALFLTLIFLTAAFVIIGMIIKNYQKITSKDYTFISQNSVIISDTLNTLKNLDINSSEDLNKILGEFPITSKNGEFRGVISISAISTININDYYKNKKIDKNIDKLIDFLALKYDIKDPIYLKDLILDTIDKDKIERSAYSEIINENPFFQNGKIYTKKQFSELLNYYQKQTLDKNVKKVPWKKYFNFYISQLYNPQKDIITLNEKNETDFNIISFEKAKNFYVEIGIDYAYHSKQKINIIYDIKNKKVLRVEVNPIY